jgi:hypothetical protein
MRRRFWSFSVVALALGLACGGDGITGPAPRVPTLRIVSGGGDNQSGPAGSTLPLPVVVQVTGVSGSANGQILNFAVTKGGGRVFANVVMTGTPRTGPYSRMTGIAENTWTLGDSTGPQTMEARLIDPSTGATLTQAIFHATASPAGNATLKIMSGDKQTGVAGTALRDSAKVRVVDKFGNPLVGVSVAFRIATGAGTSGTGVVSGQDGTAATRWFLGRTVGANTLTAFLGSDSASPGASPVTFTATGVPGAAAQLTAVTGNAQHGALGSTLPISPAVQVRDVNDNGVAGVAVTFTVTAGGGSMAGITSVTTLSDTSGKASVGWTLGSAPGPNTLRATALGLTGSPVIFGATSYTPLYVANQQANSITVYEAEAAGNLTPVRTISGPSTGLSLPAIIVRDSQGQLYVTNYTGNSITIYAAGADGNVAPVRTITGSNTGFTRPYALALDAAGQIYVFDYASHTINVFASDANGNASPLRTIGGANAGLAGAPSMTVAANGEIYVADQDVGNVKVFAAGASGDVAPIRIIGGPGTGLGQPATVLLDSSGQLYVSDYFRQAVYVFAAGATGDVSPVRVIIGPNTTLLGAVGLLLDATGQIYVATNSTNTIAVFATGATGNATPARIIQGSNTGLNHPGGITF